MLDYNWRQKEGPTVVGIGEDVASSGEQTKGIRITSRQAHTEGIT